MEKDLAIKNHLQLVDSIIKSTEDLVKLLEKEITISNTIFNTISEIFNFLEKTINLLPDILILKNRDSRLSKKEIVDSYEDTKLSWFNFVIEQDDFFNKWNDFSNIWKKFYKALSYVNSSSNTIYLSMN